MRLVAVRFLLGHLAGVLRPISPWRWMAVVRGRRTVEAAPAAVRRVADPLSALPLALIITFLVSTTVGYALSAIFGRARRGRAFECVEYFFLLSLAIIPVTAFVIAIPVGAPWLQPATVAACVAAAAVIVIGLVAISRGMEDQKSGPV